MSSAEIATSTVAELDRANHCESARDCRKLPWTVRCQNTYGNAAEDLARLDQLWQHLDDTPEKQAPVLATSAFERCACCRPSQLIMGTSAPPTRIVRHRAPVDVAEPWSFDGAFEHANLVPQSENFGGQLGAGPDECEAGQKQGTQEVQHGRRA